MAKKNENHEKSENGGNVKYRRHVANGGCNERKRSGVMANRND
jgi:hypothetical protein